MLRERIAQLVHLLSAERNPQKKAALADEIRELLDEENGQYADTLVEKKSA